MKKHLLAFIIYHSSFIIAFSQAGMWTWMKGDSVIDAPAVTGIKGVEDALNKPPGLYEVGEWKDSAGNFWIFGGVGVLGSYVYSDLWKYNPTTNNWTWVNGPGVPRDTGSYGTMGVPSPSNLPPARGYGFPTWVDKNGDFWLYGGWRYKSNTNSGNGGDLWRYNIATDQWTWMNGTTLLDQNPVLGIQGIPSPNNTPGGIEECSATWVDDSSNLWLYYKVLWKYDVRINQWTWIKGDTGAAVRGTKGIEGSLNHPGPNPSFATWKDKRGNFWLYGGTWGHPEGLMWRYNMATNNWTWMTGVTQGDALGSYGPFCVAGSNYYPTSRFETRTRWTDRCGNFWLYGGFLSSYSLADLWCFNPDSVKWLLVEGNSNRDLPPVYGSRGIPSAANTPGARCGSASWLNGNYELYLFGSLQQRNDVWRYTIDTSCLGSFNCSLCGSGNGGAITALNDTVCRDQPPVLHFSGIVQNVQWQYSTDGTNYNDLVGLTGEDCLDIPTQTSYYRVKSTDGNCPLMTEPIKIVVDTTCQITDINDQWAEGSVLIYPNPSSVSSLKFNVDSRFAGGDIRVFDANGRLLLDSKLETSNSQLDFNFPPGIYFIRIQSERGSVVKRFVRL